MIPGSLYAAVLLGGAHAVGRDRRRPIPGLVLAILAIGLQWASLATRDIWLQRFSGITFVIFLMRTIGEAPAHILKKGPITADKLHGALAGCIMLAFLWDFFYTLIESLSLARLYREAPGSIFTSASCICFYISFTTLTTTGFGYIKPVSDQAGSVAIIEECIGGFFVGVFQVIITDSPRTPKRKSFAEALAAMPGVGQDEDFERVDNELGNADVSG